MRINHKQEGGRPLSNFNDRLSQLKKVIDGSNSPSIFICSPAYSGDVSCQFVASLLQTLELLRKNNIGYSVYFSVFDSLVARSRNDLVDKFLKSNCTHILMIDSDQGWTPEAVPSMMKLKKDFITGAVVSRKPNCEEYAFKIYTNQNRNPRVTNEGLLECETNGVAFGMMSRNVFETLKSREPSRHDIYPFFQHKYYDNGDHYGEDTYFIKQWKKYGKVWLYPNITFHHGTNVGNYHEFLMKQPGGATHEQGETHELSVQPKMGA